MTKLKKLVFDIIQIGNKANKLSRAFDIFIVCVIFANLAVTFAYTFDEMEKYNGILDVIELVTIIIFTLEYILRLWTADMLYPKKTRFMAVLSFVFSFYGLVDLLTFFPYYLPIVFPAGAVAFRVLRVIRIFRLFKLNAQYDAFNVIVDVLNEKKSQIASSVCMIFILMMASSLCMYSLEHDAQPEQFSNAFSGIWWSVSTLLTVGYGDIYPVTISGKIMAIVISFLGVGMVAIPTGIISAGFVEKYTDIKTLISQAEEKKLKFVTSMVTEKHCWHDKMLKEVIIPPQLILVIILRDGDEIVPKGDTVLKTGDMLVFGAKSYEFENEIELKEILVKEEHEWVGEPIKELDISRQELIVMIQRRNKTIIPNGNTVIKNGDRVVMYAKRNKEK